MPEQLGCCGSRWAPRCMPSSPHSLAMTDDTTGMCHVKWRSTAVDESVPARPKAARDLLDGYVFEVGESKVSGPETLRVNSNSQRSGTTSIAKARVCLRRTTGMPRTVTCGRIHLHEETVTRWDDAPPRISEARGHGVLPSVSRSRCVVVGVVTAIRNRREYRDDSRALDT